MHWRHLAIKMRIAPSAFTGKAWGGKGLITSYFILVSRSINTLIHHSTMVQFTQCTVHFQHSLPGDDRAERSWNGCFTEVSPSSPPCDALWLISFHLQADHPVPPVFLMPPLINPESFFCVTSPTDTGERQHWPAKSASSGFILYYCANKHLFLSFIPNLMSRL